MSWLNEIRNFLEDYSGVYADDPDIDIFSEMGIVGDDFHEMIDAFSQEYGVDMSNYLWYFHTDEEGQNFGGLFFKPPHRRVERIPVTPQTLAKFIETKRWEIDYPKHSLPKRRYDLLINAIIFILSIIGIIVFAILKWGK